MENISNIALAAKMAKPLQLKNEVQAAIIKYLNRKDPDELAEMIIRGRNGGEYIMLERRDICPHWTKTDWEGVNITGDYTFDVDGVHVDFAPLNGFFNGRLGFTVYLGLTE